MILADFPNTLLIYSKRHNLRENEHSEKANDEEPGEANVLDSPHQNYSVLLNDERYVNEANN